MAEFDIDTAPVITLYFVFGYSNQKEPPHSFVIFRRIFLILKFLLQLMESQSLSSVRIVSLVTGKSNTLFSLLLFRKLSTALLPFVPESTNWLFRTQSQKFFRMLFVTVQASAAAGLCFLRR